MGDKNLRERALTLDVRVELRVDNLICFPKIQTKKAGTLRTRGEPVTAAFCPFCGERWVEGSPEQVCETMLELYEGMKLALGKFDLAFHEMGLVMAIRDADGVTFKHGNTSTTLLLRKTKH